MLEDYESFINIENRFNGGYQHWLYTEQFKSEFWANRSCGVVAAANTAYYLTEHHNMNLYDQGTLNIANFTGFINELFEFVRPFLLGIPTLTNMNRGFLKFARSKGEFNLKSRIHKNFNDKTETIRFISNALKKNYPIMMLNWNSDIRRLKYHWVTIIGYFKDESEEYILISNWGHVEKIQMDQLFKDKSIYKGLIYFEL